MIYSGEALRAVAMPLGGLGTGNLALKGDGSLVQWQISNRIDHKAYVPHSFFGISWGYNTGRVLISDELWGSEISDPKTSNDHVVPSELKVWASGLPLVRVASYEGQYPASKITYDAGADCPFSITMTAWSPMVPENPDDSGWPVAVFDFEITNRGDKKYPARLLATLQNITGWNGISVINGRQNPGYGGNRNHADRIGGVRAVTLGNASLAEDDPSNGEQALLITGEKVTLIPQWAKVEELWPRFLNAHNLEDANYSGASEPGATWNSAAVSEVMIEPGQTVKITVVHAWHFPNRYVDYDQWVPHVPKDKSRFYLGNQYANRGGMREWLSSFMPRLEELRSKTLGYVASFYGQNLPAAVLDAVGSNVGNLRTNICMWTENGKFHGFEGGHGVSTWLGDCANGGCCPMDCTHVWNYEQTLVQLWPSLFRTMRDTEWKVNQHPKGYIPHRTILPIYMPPLWERSIGGPENPALDGLCAEILKTYQYLQRTGDREWLDGILPKLKAALGHIWRQHDDQGDGMIRGEQPNTYDIHLYGPNTYMGTQYLAALRAAEEMLKLYGDGDASECRRRFESGSKLYDETCWNGNYYVQRIPEGLTEPYQFGEGCVADQLLGQFWADDLGLGSLLPDDHIEAALKSVFRLNFRNDFVGFKQTPRVYAADHDKGLLNGSYEPHQRPEVPLLYSDEVWPGVEYLYAALCIHRGLVDEALTVVEATRGRYDGKIRNPFNEVECGDHYIRSLAGWAILDALHGVRYSAHDKMLHLPTKSRLSSLSAVLRTAFGPLEISIEDRKGTITASDGPVEVDKTSTGDGPFVLEPGKPYTFAVGK